MAHKKSIKLLNSTNGWLDLKTKQNLVVKIKKLSNLDKFILIIFAQLFCSAIQCKFLPYGEPCLWRFDGFDLA